MVNKLSDRTKYNPDGKNDYSSPKEKPARYDLRRRHKIKDDPLDKKDRKMEEKLSFDNEEENNMSLDNTSDLAKKIAKKKIKVAARPSLTEMKANMQREGLENFVFKDDGIRAIAKTYKNLADSFLNMTKAVNSFTSCKSSEISPDGKLGGKGYIQTIKDVRSCMADCLNNMSELLDTFHDEVNSPYWKKTTIEDNPIVKEILEKANDSLGEAMELEGDSDSKNPEKIVLSEEEKNKVLSILKSKGHF